MSTVSASLFDVTLYAFFPIIAAIGGAALAAYRRPNSTVRSYIQHLAAGVVFSVVAVELLPEITAKHKRWRWQLDLCLAHY